MKRTLALLAMAAALFGSAFAQTAAGTSIRNQASATYLGITTPVTSNEVFTIVQQVYSFTITPDGTTSAPGQTRSALPGANVYFAYRITNTGNGTDTINLTNPQDSSPSDDFDVTGVSIYDDGNCNGQVDPGENTLSAVTLTRAGTAGEYACVVVKSTIPVSATNAQKSNLNLSGTSAGDNTKTDTNNWARAVATTAAALDINKSASPTGLVNPGANITYTITGQNRGGSAAAGYANAVTVDTVAKTAIFISDIFPAALTYAGSFSASAGAGTVTKVYYNGTSWTATAPAAASTKGVGILIEGTGAFFPQNASYSMSFQVTVPAGATPSTSYDNTASVYYNDNGSPASNNSSTASSPTHNIVAASYSVALGPNGYPAGDATGTAYTAGAYSVTPNLDTQTIASANTGTTVIFKHTLKNTSNASDSFNLSLGTAPTGWTCSLVPSSGSGFISGAVGPVTAGSNYDFQVQCAIAANATSAAAQSIVVTATSVADTSKTDTTTDTVTAVVSGYGVDIAQKTQAGDADNSDDNYTSAVAVNPGASTNFLVDVYNAGSTSDTYNLSATTPSGWSVDYYNDANNNGVIDSGESIVTSSGLLAAGATAHLIAVVSVPSSAAPVTGSGNVTFTSTSTTLGTVTDSMTASVSVNLVQNFTFTPDRNSTVTTPGTVTYSHSLVNNGNAAATVAIPAYTSAFSGWVYQFSTDGSTWSSSISGLSLAANGGTSPLYVRVQTPAGEPVGRLDTAVFTATATYTGGSTASASVTDRTTIISGNLQLLKDWTVDSGATYWKGDGTDAGTPPKVTPGSNITYRIRASNIGTADLQSVKISDPLPANTSFVSVSASTSITGTVLYSTDGTTWSATAPTSLATGGSVYVAVDTNGDTNITSADLVAPAATITLTFVVKVQ